VERGPPARRGPHWLSFQSSGRKGGWHYRQLFELTRLDEAIAIYGTEADAARRRGRALSR
jgi:hypothetical protein